MTEQERAAARAAIREAIAKLDEALTRLDDEPEPFDGSRYDSLCGFEAVPREGES